MKSSRKSRARDLILARDGPKCFYCGGETDVVNLRAPNGFTLEHLINSSNAGGNAPSNLVGAGRKCNQFVGDRPLVDKLKLRDNWPANAPRCTP